MPATSVVAGIQSEDLGAEIEAVRIVSRVDGVERGRETVKLRVPGAGPTFPREVKLASASGAGTAEVEIAGLGSNGVALLTRRARTSFVGGQSRLMRVRLESRCVEAVTRGGAPAPGTAIPSAPVCVAPETCVGGRCVDSHVAVGELEPYRVDWAENPPDVCKPATGGPPHVIVGTGQTDYGNLNDGQTLQAELGPQGGHHVWIAVRMRGLRQSGSRTILTATQPGTGLTVPPTAFVFTFDRDEGGYCKLYGLRFQLDSGAANLGEDYKKFLGKPLDITVAVEDAGGLKAQGTARIQIAPTILCPSGVGTCT